MEAQALLPPRQPFFLAQEPFSICICFLFCEVCCSEVPGWKVGSCRNLVVEPPGGSFARFLPAPPCPQTVHTAEGIWGANGGGGVAGSFCPPSQVHPGESPSRPGAPLRQLEARGQTLTTLRAQSPHRSSFPRGLHARPRAPACDHHLREGSRPLARCGRLPQHRSVRVPAAASAHPGRHRPRELSGTETAPRPHTAGKYLRRGGWVQRIPPLCV